MSKKRKTRKQKIRAQYRHELAQEKKSAPEKFKFTPSPSTSSLASTSYYHPYLKKELTKTGVISTSIILVALFMFFLLKIHVLLLPMLTY